MLKNAVWWFNWQGFSPGNGATKTFTTADGLNVTVTFSNVSGPLMAPSVMRVWSGAVLHFLYDFTDPAIAPALASNATSQTVAFRMRVAATRNGVPAAFTLCAADAEASAATMEYTTLTTTGSNWNILEFFRNSMQTTSPVTGCGTSTVVITDTHAPAGAPGAQPIGQNPLMATNAPSSGIIDVDVNMRRTVAGGMALAFGVFAPIDRGDLPASYGDAQHRWVYATANVCNTNPPFPSISQSTGLKLGRLHGDADAPGNTDDNMNGADEDALTTFPDYTGSGTYRLDLPVTNQTGTDAYLSGWFDYNRNGAFEAGEMVMVTVPPLAASATLTWTNLPAAFTHGPVRDFGFRFRISTDRAAVTAAAGVAPDGEVEDYLAHLIVPCNNVVTFPAPSVKMCEGASIQLSTTQGLSVYEWAPAVGLSAADVANPVASPAANVTYTVTGTADDGCRGSAAITVNVHPVPVVTPGADANICEGAAAQLSANSSLAGVTYNWAPATGLDNPAIANPLATPQATTRYTVTATTSNGCSAAEDVLVEVRPKRVPRAGPGVPDICKGASLTLEASGGDVFQWLGPGNTLLGTDAQLPLTPDQSAVYTVNITDNDCGGTTSLQVPVTVSELAASVAKSNDVSCSAGTAVLTATGGTHYLWEPAPGINDPTAARQQVMPQQTTTYHLTIINGACSKKESVTVAVDFTAGLSAYPMPNAFTPNNDGKNDCFGLKFWGPVISLEFNIYNRWGMPVFSTTNPQDCWDGFFKGEAQPAGAYVYWIKAKTLCGDAERKGHVTLLR